MVWIIGVIFMSEKKARINVISKDKNGCLVYKIITVSDTKTRFTKLIEEIIEGNFNSSV